MKTIKLISMVLLIVMNMLGCQSKQEEIVSTTFTKAVEEGKLAIAEYDYEKASNMFTLALEEKQDDEVSKLNQQCKLAIKLQEKLEDIENKEYTDEESANDDLDEILQLCDKIISIDSKSNLIKDKVKEVKVEFDSLRAEVEKIKKEDKEQIEEAHNNVETYVCENCEKVSREHNFIMGMTVCNDCHTTIFEENFNEDEIVNSYSDNYTCVICGNKTNTLCQYDECAPLCEDDMGYYCECGEYHHTQELCPIFDV